MTRASEPVLAGMARRQGGAVWSVAPWLRAFPLWLGVAAVLAFVLAHCVWPLALPPPWLDEVHFLIPAASFAAQGSFSAERMLVSEIYWIPASYYVVNGLAFLLAGHADLGVARAVSFAAIAGAAWMLRGVLSVALGAADRRWPLPGHALALAWFVSLPVVFAGNIARPDALVILASVASLACLLRGRLVGGFGLAALAFLLHPLLGIPACATAAASLPALRRMAWPKGRDGWWEWLILAAAVGLLGLEAVRLAADFAEYRSHWAFQLSRKAERSVGGVLVLVAAMAGVALLADLAGQWRGRPGPAGAPVRRMPVLAFGLTCVLVFLYGQEMWYFPFLLLGLVLVVGTILGSLRAEGRGATLLGSSVLPLAILVAGCSSWGLGLRDRGVFGFQLRPASLTRVDGDLRQVSEAIRARLGEAGARQVLVDPVLAYEFLGDGEGAVPAVLTWTPLSRGDGRRFDHVVIAERAYPIFRTELPEGLLVDHACRLETMVVSPGGDYRVRIVAVAFNGTAGRPFIGCPSR